MIALQSSDTAGSMFVPIVMGSDKTTVSVATGQNDYWPLYASIGNVHNNIRRAHGNGLVLVSFLANPKSLLSFLLLYKSFTTILIP
jgi:Plavaka transposase